MVVGRSRSFQSVSEAKTSGAVISAWVLGIVFLILVGLTAFQMIARLDAMTADVARVSSSVESVDRDLRELHGASPALREMSEQLAVANRSLSLTNQTLSALGHSAHQAEGSLGKLRRSVAAVQGDIRIMSQKISRSALLFR